MPRNYIPSVEEGVITGLKQGPLGFPVVDVSVTLTDGSYHTVNSSDMAFQLAGRLAMNEGLPQCNPVLLEPIHHVEVVCPNDATAKINAIISGRRGQLLGFDTREDWTGWDVVRALMPESEIGDLIIEVRSATAGVGSFTFKFDHMQELTGKPPTRSSRPDERRSDCLRCVPLSSPGLTGRPSSPGARVGAPSCHHGSAAEYWIIRFRG